MLKSRLIPWMLICLYILLEISQAISQDKLSMMPNAFDDQYIGCETEMDVLAPGLLEKEKSNSSLFSKVWENSEQKWQSVKTTISLPKDFKDEYGRAVIAYTDNDFHAELNQAVRENGKSQAHYMANFKFKAFHYYLTRALRLLKESCSVMFNKTVYRGTEVSHTGSDIMRFGFFASSSLVKTKAEKFGTATVFTIHTCFGRDIRAFSHFLEEEEVLIPVHETFHVVKGQESNSFILRSTNRTCNCFNCAYLGEKKKSDCIENSANRGSITLTPSLFGGATILIQVAAMKLFASF